MLRVKLAHPILPTSLIYPTRRLLSLNVANSSRTNTHTSSVNPSEISHFSRLSSQWWNEQGEFGLLHKMNPPRIQFIRDKFFEIGREDEGEAWANERAGADFLSGMDVLDVGCGGGILSESLARSGARTLGVDASESNIAIASIHALADPLLTPSASHMRNGSLKYRHCSAEDLVQEQQRFDMVCSMEVIEHVDNPADFLRSLAELVKPGGHLFLSTIARTPLAYALTILAAERILRLVEPGTHTHSKYINPAELVEFFHQYCSPSTLPSSSMSSIRAPSLEDESSKKQGRSWITRTYDYGLPTRTEAEVRGLVYVPWKCEWVLMPRVTTPWATDCNYMFWVRRPKE